MGYFDCAFYSLRQSLEIAATVAFFVDDESENRTEQISKWKKQEKFPLHSQMINELKQRQKEFADIKKNMPLYFEELELIKQKLNKYVHKQGLDKFYTYRNHIINKNKENWINALTNDFESYLKTSIGAIAVFRLVIDPYPILLNDEKVYARTGQILTRGFSDDFISNYIGVENIMAYKQTGMYQGHYDSIMKEEEMLPSVLDIIKHEYIDKSKIDEILSQKHLLGQHDLIALELVIFSEKIVKVYCIGGFKWYFTNNTSNRISSSFHSIVLSDLKEQKDKFNSKYDEVFLSYLIANDEVFLSYLIANDEDYFIEHNEEFIEKEILELKKISTTHNTRYQ
jgi:hypothetical protein